MISISRSSITTKVLFCALFVTAPYFVSAQQYDDIEVVIDLNQDEETGEIILQFTDDNGRAQEDSFYFDITDQGRINDLISIAEGYGFTDQDIQAATLEIVNQKELHQIENNENLIEDAEDDLIDVKKHIAKLERRGANISVLDSDIENATSKIAEAKSKLSLSLFAESESASKAASDILSVILKMDEDDLLNLLNDSERIGLQLQIIKLLTVIVGLLQEKLI